MYPKNTIEILILKSLISINNFLIQSYKCLQRFLHVILGD